MQWFSCMIFREMASMVSPVRTPAAMSIDSSPREGLATCGTFKRVKRQRGIHSSELLFKPFQAAWDTSIAYSADKLRSKVASVLCKEVLLILRMHILKIAGWGSGACLEAAWEELAIHCNSLSSKL